MRLDRVARVVLTAAAVGFLVYYVDPSAMMEAVADADPWWIAAAVALLPANVWLDAVMWHKLFLRVRPATSFRESFGAMLAGFSLGFFTPGRAGELAGRAFYLQHPDRWETAAVVIVQRLYDTAVAVSVGAVALFINRIEDVLPIDLVWDVLAVAGVLIGGVLVAAGLAPGVARRWLVPVLPKSWQPRLDFLGRLSARDGAIALGLAAARYAVYVTQFFLLLRALEYGPVLMAYAGIGLVFFAKFLIPSVTLMDLGVREGAAVFFLDWLGFSEAAALNASLMLFAVNVVLPSAAGIRFVMKLRLGNSEPVTHSEGYPTAEIPEKSVSGALKERAHRELEGHPE